ncbi:hypothetical protein [Kosakonia oryzae]|uniref:hypothetical protein n=1 Tax=Kosakonia oryzae TaxID=497725 RepID=UPI001D061051|nr:hypothetical protein [Kosakonia oryzae]UDJ85248.1 hypothetical protein I5186_00805 [Kosakonia oryzae]
MTLPGMNPERNLPGYELARMTGYGTSDFDFKALGTSMDCSREFSQAGIIYADGSQRHWRVVQSVVLLPRQVISHVLGAIWLAQFSLWRCFDVTFKLVAWPCIL